VAKRNYLFTNPVATIGTIKNQRIKILGIIN